MQSLLHGLMGLLAGLVDGRVFTPKLPRDPKQKTMRARIATAFPALAVREIQDGSGDLQVKCFADKVAESKALARDVIAQAEMDGGYTLVGDYDLESVPDPDPDGRINHVALRFAPIDKPLFAGANAGDSS